MQNYITPSANYMATAPQLYQPMPQAQQPLYQPMYGMVRPQEPFQAVQGPIVKTRVVTSENEAMGVPVDFDASVLIMPDLPHGMIYAKQWNANDGSATFRKYRIVQDEQPNVSNNIPNNANNYVTSEQLEAFKGDISQYIDNKFASFKPEEPKVKGASKA